MTVKSGAALLYYNTPASVFFNGSIYIGYITNSGKVEVSMVAPAERHVTSIQVHDYGKPDDHAAPALWATDSGILVATSFHSSDLFLYRIANGTAEQICHWPGKYTYPRFDEVDGSLRLYVRYEPARLGHLAVIEAPDRCNPAQILQAAQPEQWLYATPPDQGSVAWSIWDSRTKLHGQSFHDGQPIRLAPSDMKEALVWSISGPLRSVTRFSDAFTCCGSGTMISELYHGDRLIFSSAPMANPYYPTGTVISRRGDEAIFPTPNEQVQRQSLPSLEALPSCDVSRKYNSRAQYVRNGNGAYVWLEFDEIDIRSFPQASVVLCLPH